MSQVLTPPASHHASESPELEQKKNQAPEVDVAALTLSLDGLLERYLDLLDQHQQLQKEMASRLSSGFLSLAQANYTCPPGRRYGADYYDDRMKATKRMTVHLSPDTRINDDQSGEKDNDRPANSDPLRQIFNIETCTANDSGEQSEEDKKTHLHKLNKEPPKAENSDTEEGSDSEAANPTITDDVSNKEIEPTTESNRSKQKPRSSDPLRWYGILVPPSLRNAQKSFTNAVEDYLPALSSVVVEMQTVEKEISQILWVSDLLPV
ncbi:hypothetical protein FE257_008674 [Aspergillus nanangensis]|uniref:Vacuolar ATPase assembly protein VMA22 n=1 Tax=Aspergillus nanangensis TaxID=2582783 RepID=A0AAD4CKZ0_ASPNN|nr:hypothetical protein FE257_008674 [Aspergillus nanangensis]